MDKSVFKVFFSREKEADWLNRMGKEGYLLLAISDSKYKFSYTEGAKYWYSIEHIGCSPLSDEAVEYFKSREESGIMPVLSSSNWVYFVSTEAEIECTEDICKKNARFYLWRIIYLLFFSVCGAVLCGYHAFSIGHLQAIEQVGDGQIDLLATGTTMTLFNAIKIGFNYVLKAINAYFSIWTDLFGKNDAVAVIAAIVPIMLILLVIASFNLDSYILYTKKKKSLKTIGKMSEIEGVYDAEQKI